MFRCYFCHQVTPPKTTKHSVIIAVREKEYPTRRRESKRSGGAAAGRFRPREDAVQDRGGKGNEIAKEVAACPACAAKHHEPQVEAAMVVATELVADGPLTTETAAIKTAAAETAATETAETETAETETAETETAETETAETETAETKTVAAKTED